MKEEKEGEILKAGVVLKWHRRKCIKAPTKTKYQSNFSLSYNTMLDLARVKTLAQGTLRVHTIEYNCSFYAQWSTLSVVIFFKSLLSIFIECLWSGYRSSTTVERPSVSKDVNATSTAFSRHSLLLVYITLPHCFYVKISKKRLIITLMYASALKIKALVKRNVIIFLLVYIK